MVIGLTTSCHSKDEKIQNYGDSTFQNAAPNLEQSPFVCRTSWLFDMLETKAEIQTQVG
jgi:hypothetical protein